MSTNETDQVSDGRSWPSNETNPVSTRAPENSLSDEEIVQSALDRFSEEYPDRAELPLSRQHGRKLRRVCTVPTWSDQHVETTDETEPNFSVQALDERRAVRWKDALASFLHAHLDYKGLYARFENDGGDEFEIPMHDAWGPENASKQYARAKAIERQIGGGEFPGDLDADDLAGDWDDPATIMLTLTASGDGLAPVDHLDKIADSWTGSSGCRATLRNALEYHCGLESDDWGYWTQDEPHGMGDARSDTDPGPNACYTHRHVAVYFDAAAVDDDVLATDDTHRLHGVGKEVERVIDKHLGQVPEARRAAHPYHRVGDYTNPDTFPDGGSPISVKPDLHDLGCYMAAYLGAQNESLVEKPIEYLAWGALYWASARRRSCRSNSVNDMIKADRCYQRARSDDAVQTADHGDNLEWDDAPGPDVRCAECGASWGVSQDALDEPVTDDDLADALDDAELDDPTYAHPSDRPMRERWPTASAGASTGERLERVRLRDRLDDLPGRDRDPDRLPVVLGKLGLDPGDREFVHGELTGDPVDPDDSFERLSLDDDWRLAAIIDKDGDEHQPGGGGVDMAPLKKPVDAVNSHPRFRARRSSSYPGADNRCLVCGAHQASQTRYLAHHLVEDHGITDPDLANRCVRFVHPDYLDDAPDRVHPPEDQL